MRSEIFWKRKGVKQGQIGLKYEAVISIYVSPWIGFSNGGKYF